MNFDSYITPVLLYRRVWTAFEMIIIKFTEIQNMINRTLGNDSFRNVCKSAVLRLKELYKSSMIILSSASLISSSTIFPWYCSMNRTNNVVETETIQTEFPVLNGLQKHVVQQQYSSTAIIYMFFIWETLTRFHSPSISSNVFCNKVQILMKIGIMNSYYMDWNLKSEIDKYACRTLRWFKKEIIRNLHQERKGSVFRYCKHSRCSNLFVHDLVFQYSSKCLALRGIFVDNSESPGARVRLLFFFLSPLFQTIHCQMKSRAADLGQNYLIFTSYSAWNVLLK